MTRACLIATNGHFSQQCGALDARISNSSRATLSDEGAFLGVRLPPVEDDELAPWTVSPSRRRKESQIVGELRRSLELVLGNEIDIAKDGLVPGLRNRLLRAAAFQNPDFYKAQAMRLPTYDKQRIIACAEDHPHHIGLPRGCLDDVGQALTDLNIRPVIRDERYGGQPLHVRCQGELRPDQKLAAGRDAEA